MPEPADYTELTPMQIVERLAAAERVCILYGALEPRLKTDPEKAAFMLWQRWMELTAEHPDIDQSDMNPAFIFNLARARDIQARQVFEADRANRKKAKDAQG